ncbi:type IV secretion system DNA-binding domain-containing protein (plasmid) [Sphingomonas sp. NY01]|uniref:type IV secretion system DNA-binding domain-containing protein n=1 Tax=Sphingomonas sp. NY01 TaxID=2968057 RepID=UPI00315DE7F6
MGISYPFRFQREPEPARPRLTIASPDTLPADTLRAVRMGNGDRIVVIGAGDAFTALADQTRDLMIDPARGNWDFFADHPSDYARSSAVEAFIPIDPGDRDASWHFAGRYVLARAIEHIGKQPGAMLAGVRDLVRDLPPDALAEFAGHDTICGQGVRWAETVLAGVRTPLHQIANHDPRMPKTSIVRWLAGPASTILFIHRDLDRADHKLQAIVASLRDHAMLGRIKVEKALGTARLDVEGAPR